MMIMMFPFPASGLGRRCRRLRTSGNAGQGRTGQGRVGCRIASHLLSQQGDKDCMRCSHQSQHQQVEGKEGREKMTHLALGAQAVGAVYPHILGNDFAVLGELEVFLEVGGIGGNR